MKINNCKTCEHKQHPDGGHCYMFREEPQTRCHQHTALPYVNSVVFGEYSKQDWIDFMEDNSHSDFLPDLGDHS